MQVLANTFKTLVPEIAISGLATMASVGTSALGAYLLSGVAATWAGTLAASVAVVVVPAVACWLTMKVLNYGWEWWNGSPEARELQQLCQKYELPVDTDLNELHRIVRRQSLKMHPDRPGGSNQQFHALSKDLKRISELMMSQVQKQHGKKDRLAPLARIMKVLDHLREACQKWCSGKIPGTAQNLEDELLLLENLARMPEMPTHAASPT